jgi:hypothetical protein
VIPKIWFFLKNLKNARCDNGFACGEPTDGGMRSGHFAAIECVRVAAVDGGQRVPTPLV